MMKNILVVTFLLLSNIQADFVRDNSLEVVNDTTTCMMWQDDSDSKTVTKSWQDAIGYCQNLNFAGYSDWRLPNIYELISITDEQKYNPAIEDKFENVVSSAYWSSTTDASDTNLAWYVYFSNGGDNWDYKGNGNYVRCVRAGQ